MYLFSCTCRSFDAETNEETTRYLVVDARDFFHAELLAHRHLHRHHGAKRVVHSVDVHLRQAYTYVDDDADEAKNQADAAYNRGD